MTFVKLLLRSGLLVGLGYVLYKQWHNESAGAAEWLAAAPATTRPAQSIPEDEDELAFSDAEEEGWPANDPFEGQDPLTAPLPEDL